MTKKHFEWAAAFVRRYPEDGEARAVLRDGFSRLFEEFNLRFRYDQFLAACNGEDYEAPTRSGRTITRRYSKVS